MFVVCVRVCERVCLPVLCLCSPDSDSEFRANDQVGCAFVFSRRASEHKESRQIEHSEQEPVDTERDPAAKRESQFEPQHQPIRVSNPSSSQSRFWSSQAARIAALGQSQSASTRDQSVVSARGAVEQREAGASRELRQRKPARKLQDQTQRTGPQTQPRGRVKHQQQHQQRSTWPT